MITENFNWQAEIRINSEESFTLNANQDTFKWFYLKTNDQHWSFEFRIKPEQKIVNGIPFLAGCRFLAGNDVIGRVSLNTEYDLLSGRKLIGTIKLISGPL